MRVNEKDGICLTFVVWEKLAVVWSYPKLTSLGKQAGLQKLVKWLIGRGKIEQNLLNKW